jgi:hypothetical protein
MKIAPKKPEMKRAAVAEPPIPLMRVKREIKVESGDLIKFEMKVHPDDVNSTLKYTKTVARLDSDCTPEQTLLWSRDLKSVLENQRITTATGKIATLSRIVKEDLWPIAEAKLNKAANATEAAKTKGYTEAVEALLTKMFPNKALNKQKAYMHCHLRKPVEMKLRDYMERIQTLNNYLKEFPPFSAGQEIPDDALVDICYHGLPKSWKEFLLLQGFDEQEGSIATLLDMAERIETMEAMSRDMKKPAVAKRERSGQEGSEKPNKKSKTSHFCEYHGSNFSHDTKDCSTCKSILQSARKSRDDKNADKPSSSGTTDYKKKATFGKPWAKTTKSEDIQAMFTEALANAASSFKASTKAKGKKMPTQEFHNLNLEDDDDKSDSGSDDSQSSSDEE